VPTNKREDWYERQLEAGVEVVVCHPKLVETGLDLLAFPTLYFYQTGYSLHTLRQASRNTVHLIILMAVEMSMAGSGLARGGRSGKLLILRLIPRGLRRLRLDTTRSCRISSRTAR
jgi:hypothetical protein